MMLFNDNMCFCGNGAHIGVIPIVDPMRSKFMFFLQIFKALVEVFFLESVNPIALDKLTDADHQKPRCSFRLKKLYTVAASHSRRILKRWSILLVTTNLYANKSLMVISKIQSLMAWQLFGKSASWSKLT